MKNLIPNLIRFLALSLLLSTVQIASAFYDPNTQRWINRDPIGETGGINLSGFVANNAISHYDAVGLFFAGCSRDPCADPCGDAKKAKLDKGHVGGTVCCGGKKYSCVWKPSGVFGASSKKAQQIISKCVKTHEDTHLDDIDCPSGPGVTRPPYKSGKDSNAEECSGFKVNLSCLKSSISDCAGDPQCIAQVLLEIKYVKAAIEIYCGP